MDPQPSTSAGAGTAVVERPTQSDDEQPPVKRHLYVAESLKMWNLGKLMRKLGTHEQCLEFSEENNLILKTKLCRVHKKPMRLDFTTYPNVGGFTCDKGVCRGKNTFSRGNGTWFENVKISLPRVFYLMYAFCYRLSYDMAIHEDFIKEEVGQCLSRATINDWYSYCREVIVIYQLEKQETKGKIGGPGKIVQIDESKFGKRKYNKGRHVEGHWVLGLIEDGSEDLRLEVCPENIRSADVLIPLIKKHVEIGTTIHTDCWRAYDCLSEYGYIHKKVNHSDPDNPFVAEDGTHTQRIESQWRVIKSFFHKEHFHAENFTNLIVEYLWRRNVARNKEDPFIDLIKAINHVYKI